MSGAQKKSASICSELELKILSEISNMVQVSPAERGTLEDVLKHLGKAVDYRSASLYLFSSEDGRLEEACSVGRKVDLIDFVHFEMGSGISAWVAKHRRPVVLNNLRKSRGGTHTKSFLSVPMIFADQITGVINLAHDEPDSFNHRDAEIISIAASIIALLVERISHQEIITAKSSQMDALAAELQMLKARLTTAEKMRSASDFAAALNQKINNPLAIISGNAQFLLMTMKNSSTSVLKRLKAIDKEAANIMGLTEKMLKTASDDNENFAFSDPDENHYPQRGRLDLDRN